MDFSTILTLLNKVQNKDIKREELNSLIEKSFQISIAFLKSKFRSQIGTLKNGESTIEDIAMDAIVPLFVKNRNGKLGMHVALDKWNDNIVNTTDANYFLNRIIWRRVDQTVTSIFKERDPVFNKILKTLNEAVRNSAYGKTRYFGTVYITQYKEYKIVNEVIDETHFNTIKDEIINSKKSELFHKLFEYLLTETDFAPAIPLNLLVRRIKLYHVTRLQHEMIEHHNSDNDFTVNEVINDALDNVKKKLDNYYLIQKKLNKEEAEKILSAFVNISDDLKNGGINSSLYKYLRDFDPNLSNKTFYQKYHGTMNYLFSNFKETIAKNISI